MSVFHLKYRPKKMGELDLKKVSETLTKIFENKETPQSFLFAGPKGSGKTSAARIVARVVNCAKREGIEPCDECPSCEEILTGNSMDIIEVDAASNRGIEDIRSLKEKAYLMPSKLLKKVFIIDEVHMLTKEAFNAFLKLIEEPPVHTIFILCTTDPEKIPETVLSRLLRVDFVRGGREELLTSLQRIIEGEEIKIGKEALDLVIDKSDGSFRNLQKTFNEIYLKVGKEIKREKVVEFFTFKTGDYEPANFEADLSVGSVNLVLEKLEELAKKGIDFSKFREELIVHFQKGLLESEGDERLEIKKIIELLIKAGEQEKEAVLDQLPLELVVIEFLAGRAGQKSKMETGKEPEKQVVEEKKEAKKEIKKEVIVEEKQQVGVLSVEEVEKEWGKILMAVKPFNHSVEAFLRAARPVKIKGSVVVLEVFYPFHKDKLEEVKNREIVEKGFEGVLGASLKLECVLGKGKVKPIIIDNTTEVKMDNPDDMYKVAKEIFG